MMNPEILLLDEVTASLDPEMVREVLDVVLELARTGMTMLIVTHEMGFARKAADRIVFLADGEIIEEAHPDEFFTNRRASAPRTSSPRSSTTKAEGPTCKNIHVARGTRRSSIPRSDRRPRRMLQRRQRPQDPHRHQSRPARPRLPGRQHLHRFRRGGGTLRRR